MYSRESSNNYYTMISRFPISKTGCVCMYVCPISIIPFFFRVCYNIILTCKTHPSFDLNFLKFLVFEFLVLFSFFISIHKEYRKKFLLKI